MLNTRRLKIGDKLRLRSTEEEIVIWSLVRENEWLKINGILELIEVEGILITEEFCYNLELKSYTLKHTTKFTHPNGWNLLQRKNGNSIDYFFEHVGEFYKINYCHELNDYLDLLNLL